MPTALLSDIIERSEVGSTQFNLPKPIADAIQKFAAKIPKDKLAEGGIETESHVTAKYGLTGDDPAEVRDAVAGEGPIKAKLGMLSVFSAKESGGPDVLKFDVESPDLHRINLKLSSLPHIDTHRHYRPHATVAYLKSGDGQQYAGRPIAGVTGKTVELSELTFSDKNNKRETISLAKSPTNRP
jgi:2'-5' RNA ligase